MESPVMSSMSSVTVMFVVVMLLNVDGNGNLDRFLDDDFLEDWHLHGDSDMMGNMNNLMDWNRDIFGNLYGVRNMFGYRYGNMFVDWIRGVLVNGNMHWDMHGVVNWIRFGNMDDFGNVYDLGNFLNYWDLNRNGVRMGHMDRMGNRDNFMNRIRLGNWVWLWDRNHFGDVLDNMLMVMMPVMMVTMIVSMISVVMSRLHQRQSHQR